MTGVSGSGVGEPQIAFPQDAARRVARQISLDLAGKVEYLDAYSGDPEGMLAACDALRPELELIRGLFADPVRITDRDALLSAAHRFKEEGERGVRYENDCLAGARAGDEGYRAVDSTFEETIKMTLEEIERYEADVAAADAVLAFFDTACGE